MGCGASTEGGSDPTRRWSRRPRRSTGEGPPVARPRGANFQYEYDPETQESNIDSYEKMVVVTPPWTSTGDPIPVKTPDGQTLEVPCPPGHETGMFSSFKNYTFTCYYLPKDAS